ncbi:MAG TPA: transketolase C-terminal domain-containing protein [Candidatus Bathyarchaeia archaeon]|nr:transketolase C-terminal domain-containing protein [Candidatus Bathyarchaeia archaeon]
MISKTKKAKFKTQALNLKSKIDKKESNREGFKRGLLKAAEIDHRIVALSAGLKSSLRLSEFEKKYPDRFFELGVAEQNMIGIAAGLALTGLVPFACSFACFSPTLTFGQIRQSVCESAANVKIVGSHGGVMTGADGISHQALEDIALMRTLPEMTVIVPADSLEAEAATLAAAKINSPVYLRLTRPETPILTQGQFEIGKAQILRQGTDLTIIGCGPILFEALKAAEILGKKGISVEVINCSTIKPIDQATVITSARKTGRVLTIEDHSIFGGLGSAVAEVLGQNQPTKMKIMGMESFAQSARNFNQLIEKYRLDSYNILKECLIFFRKN